MEHKMANSFSQDPFPGKPKILFIGLAQSTHTHSWIDLLSDSGFNVRLFAMPNGLPPSDWQVKTYLSGFYAGEQNSIRNYLYSGIAGKPRIIYDKLLKRYGKLHEVSEKWLSAIIKAWRPDIIHTLGLFDDQGGEFYFNIRKINDLEKLGIWVLQVRGGADTFLRRYNPENEKQIMEMFHECDQIITDNYDNLEYIQKLGYENKIANIAPVPGTGGINLKDDCDRQRIIPPSARQRVIYWPKAYEGTSSKSLPILEAIQLAWEKIKPCTIYLTAINDETEAWLATLPDEIKKNCIASLRVPRDQALEMMKSARVMLAPSLMDGVPNVLYEAMALGAFPIVSPLESIKPIIKDEENAFFARNLYPNEIADALIRAFLEDDLIDKASKRNQVLVKKIANRQIIQPKVIEYYSSLLRNHRQPK
jgi:glycosyltransferase involved in cell wall biosynthesis